MPNDKSLATQRKLYQLSLRKPDGRALTLYSLRPISESIAATSPQACAPRGQAHLRWHPLRQEWVAFASHRQERTFLPAKEYNPLAPTQSADFPTELPAGDYDVAVFDNLFASLDLNADAAPDLIVPSRAANGHCEVVVFTQDANTSLGGLSLERIRLLLEVWSDRYEQISKQPKIRYILPFENRGVEVGVTLNHPHGQIYSYPFLPPLQEKMRQSQAEFWHANGETRTLLQDLIEKELQEKKRIIVDTATCLAWIPVCARYPYETWIAPKRAVASMSELMPGELDDLAFVLKTTLLKMDGLWGKPFPYLMALYAAPCNSGANQGWHFHIEFYPPLRTRDRLKYLAGTELGAGLFVNDSLPEEKAEELRNAPLADPRT